MIDEKISRRQLLQTVLVAAAVPAAALVVRDAGAVETLTESDPQAKSLGYVSDARKVVAAANPTYKPGQHCGNCFQFKATKAGAAEGSCVIFSGKLVKSTGWCKVWVTNEPPKTG